MIKQIIFLGSQGCGKGTQAERLARDYGFKLIGTGSILREAKFSSSKGELVSDSIVNEIVKNKLQQ